uniref:Uncharacterized protein n=1 Tax=Sphaerodactylus townsendi TaxID=933632 RepID=A0ACB8FSX4_9SAUR
MSALGYSAKEVVESWQRYRDACVWKMLEEPPPTSVVCNRTFDMYACWSDTHPNTSARVPCPWYLPWHQQGMSPDVCGATTLTLSPFSGSPAVREGFVFQKCGPDGQWIVDESGHPWRDHSQCEAIQEELPFENHLWILEQLRLMYTVGYSSSLIALVGALLLLLSFRKLRCIRNYIHMNLFLSLMLRAVSILARDSFLWLRFPKNVQTEDDISQFPMEQAAASCRVAQTLTQYCVGANYCWLLVEGLYLHNLLGLMTFSEESYFPRYLLLGWGTPILFVIPWVIVRYLYENNECWERNDHMGYWWIIRCPILVAIFVNFVIFVRIMKILFSKLRAQQMYYADYKFRLAKSTLTLIPLMGIHEVVFALVVEEQAQGILRYIKYSFELFFNSFQGLLVSVLYCFVNKEVQSEIQRKWQRCQLGASLLEKQGQSRSLWTSCRSRNSSGSSRRKKDHGPWPLSHAAENVPPIATDLHRTPLGGKSYWNFPVRMKTEDEAGDLPEAQLALPGTQNCC